MLADGEARGGCKNGDGAVAVDVAVGGFVPVGVLLSNGKARLGCGIAWNERMTDESVSIYEE